MPNQILHEGRFLRLVSDGHWEFVERCKATGVVIIVPITDAGELVFVEQHRPAIGGIAIEFPAGLAGDVDDDPDEALATAAARELVEETGYEAGELELLADAPPTAGLTSEVMTFFAARKLRRVSSGGGVAGENIVLHHVPANEVRTWLVAQQKRAHIALMVYAGLYLADINPKR